MEIDFGAEKTFRSRLRVRFHGPLDDTVCVMKVCVDSLGPLFRTAKKAQNFFGKYHHFTTLSFILTGMDKSFFDLYQNPRFLPPPNFI